ncbi:hypothetical protein C0J52_19618 [Blattella germanica]|nr:hypothetical protein C0J52_19618 [Blattella germanica]
MVVRAIYADQVSSQKKKQEISLLFINESRDVSVYFRDLNISQRVTGGEGRWYEEKGPQIQSFNRPDNPTTRKDDIEGGGGGWLQAE